jgi:hypothetical protein
MKSLIHDGWMQEGLVFVEKAKALISDRLEDLFLYEMQVLNHDKLITQSERVKRFDDLVNKMLSYKGPSTKELPEDHPENKKIAIAG